MTRFGQTTLCILLLVLSSAVSGVWGDEQPPVSRAGGNQPLAPNAPTMTAEDPYTQGTSNTVDWSDESGSGATEYYAEAATDSLFTSVVDNSGWIANITHTFTGLTDGQIYYYRVKARDEAQDESGWSNTESSTQDDTPPDTSVDPLPAYHNVFTFDVAYTATDGGSGVLGVRLFYRVDGGAYSEYGGGFTSSPISFTASGEGFYEFYTEGIDNVFNVENPPFSPDASTTVDTTASAAPTMTAEPTYTQGTSNTVAWSDESASGAAEYYAEAATDAGFTNVVDNSGWIATTSHTFTGLTDGQIYYYRAKSRDAATNESGWSGSVSSTQDASPPISSVNPLPAEQDTLTFDVAYTAGDATSGLDFVELFFQVDGGGYSSYGTFTSSPISFTAAGNGFYEFYTVGTDNVGNVEAAPASADASTTVAVGGPDAPTMDPEPTYTLGTSNTISWSDESASGATEYYAEVATDAGFTNVVDNSGWIATTSHTFTGLTDGQIYYYRVKARSDILIESDWSNVESSTQDDSPPDTSAGPLPAYHNVFTFDVPYTATDATSGVIGVELFFRVDGGGYSSYGSFISSPISFTASGEGLYEFYTVGYDSIGNIENPPLSPDAGTTVDTTASSAPTMTAEPIYTQGTSNTVAWSDESASGAAEYYAEAATDAGFTNVVDNSGWIATTSHTFTGLTDAQIYYYRAKSRDGATNESGWSANTVSSTQDASPPVSSANPLPAAQDTLIFDVAYTASDVTSGLDFVELFFQVDGGGYSSYGTFTSSPISFTAAGDGLYEFYTVGTDSVGNVEAAPETPDANTEVDTTAPDSPVMDPEPLYTQGTSNTVSWGVVTMRSPVSYWAERATDPGFTTDVENSGWISTTSHTFTGLTDGQIYYYRVKAKDIFNESGWSNTESSTQDHSPPVSSVDTLPATQDTLTFDVPYTATDATSGVDSVELFFQLDGGGYSSYGTFTSSPISFTATVDGFYEFYTVATDSVGNAEAAPASADASTTVDAPGTRTPTMAAEPTYTQGTSNTVAWSDESSSGAAEYYAEAATDAGFATVVDSSGWIPGTSHTFTGLTDGQIYYYRAKARDAGMVESGWSNVESSTQDDSPPVSSVDPLPAYQDNLTFDVPYTASDATSGVESVELFYQVDGGGYTSYGTFTSSPISFTAPGDGLYDFYTVGTDSAGNVEDAPETPDASTEVDTDTPDVPVMDSEPDYTPGTSNTVSWSTVTARSPVSYWAEGATDPGFTTDVVNSGWISETSHEFTGLTDGQIYYYRVKARDAAQNESGWSATESSTQDSSPPVTSVDPLPAVQDTTTFDVPYTASDATSGVDFVELFFQVDGGGYSSYGTFTSSPISFTATGDGFYEFYTVGTDSVGNVEDAPASADASTSVDSTAPNAPAMSPEPQYTKGTSNLVSWSNESASGATEYYAEAATDPGFANVVDNSNWIASTFHTFTDLTDGQIYYYRAKARDAALNESGWSNVESSTQDASPPVSSVDSLPPYQSELTFDVHFTASDAGSGVNLVELFYRIDGGDYASYGSYVTSPIAFTAIGDGFYEFLTIATDRAGNVEGVPDTSDAYTEVDTATPDDPVMNPEPDYTSGTSNTLSWSTVTARSPVSYWAESATDSLFTMDVVNTGWISETSYEFTGLTDGQIYYYRVKAGDAAQNESGWSNTESSTQDDSPPISSVDPLPAYQNTLTFDVPYTASDATSGVDFVELFFQVDGGGYASYGTFTSSPISFTAPGDGFYEFYTVATDSIGNVEAAPASADASTTVDTQAPDIPTMTAEPIYTQGTSNTVDWSDESGSGAAEYYAEAATDPDFTNVVDNSSWIATTSHTFTGLADGQIYYYRSKARDVALNESGWSNVESSTQDDSAPVSSVDPLPAVQDTTTFDVPYTASDATGGVDFVELFFQVDGGGYTSYGTFTSSPISFTAAGDGFYDFYTVATDSAGLVEAAPDTADASTEVDTSIPESPAMDPEPEHTPGTSNTVSWSTVTARSPVSYWAESATDSLFTSDVVNSGWISETSYEFTGLTDGQIYYYRVMARDAAQNESGWSNTESSTQDDSPPTSSVDPLPAVQDTLTFDVPYTAADATSGVDFVELLYQLDGGGYTSYGTFTISPIIFTAPGDGFYEFYTVATDSAGNVEAAPDTADASTTVDTGASSTPDEPLPDITRLLGARPNPFGASTSIRFDLHERSRVTLRVYDIRGRLIRTLIDRPMEAGRHAAEWDGKDGGGNRTSLGVYFVVWRAGNHRSVSRAVMVR